MFVQIELNQQVALAFFKSTHEAARFVFALEGKRERVVSCFTTNENALSPCGLSFSSFFHSHPSFLNVSPRRDIGDVLVLRMMRTTITAGVGGQALFFFSPSLHKSRGRVIVGSLNCFSCARIVVRDRVYYFSNTCQ